MRRPRPRVKGAGVLVIAGLVLGAILGPLRVRQLGGKRLDMLHYSAAFALLGMLLGLFATIAVQRLA